MREKEIIYLCEAIGRAKTSLEVLSYRTNRVRNENSNVVSGDLEDEFRELEFDIEQWLDELRKFRYRIANIL